ncbi:uncharacterized protein BDV14DRAFT_76307 [Aspergillus stella-maris]|uniref:uncharacterized protein n=1 Tax=Aspergillus stella-maris TaxID=1810926 RepID=UPI003CCC96B3
MKRPRKVAIIGAGPSGLVTAKTLLQNYRPGTFLPVIFEKKDRIGGLWAVEYPSETQSPHGPPQKGDSGSSRQRSRAYIDPRMRTNLSRFSVAFSDLSWETALGVDPDGAGGQVPTFPCAWEVRKYLEKYAEVYIPGDCLKLGARVLHVLRKGDRNTRFAPGRWEVAWVGDRDDKSSIHGFKGPGVQKDTFDFLIVASGHFGTPHIPRIPGLEHCPNAIHSSDLQSPDDIDCLLTKSSRQGKLVVIGGSLSGVEAATSLALHLSSQNHKSGSPASAQNAYEVVHIAPGPFWVLPKYLPQLRGDNTDSPRKISFVPLDIPLYDLGRRPPGPIELAFGPVSPEQVTQRHKFFYDTLGKDYSQTGCVGFNDQRRASDRPPWMGISDYYAEFVRSGAIKTIKGRVISTNNGGSGLTRIDINTPFGQKSLNDVAGMIMATGFKPSDSLSFLPQDVLSRLEYSKDDDFIPLILDSYSSSHSDIPDLGFVGFYRGAFWGPAELQAQMHADTWAAVNSESVSSESLAISADEHLARSAERERVRDLRNVQPTHRRGQFILGDYVGLMESLARTLGRKRLPMGNDYATNENQKGPVMPARYAAMAKHGDTKLDLTQKEVDITMEAVRGQSGQLLAGVTVAIFRALQGNWKYERSGNIPMHACGKTKYFGKAAFHPRYPSCPDHEAEHLCEESMDGLQAAQKLIYRLCNISRYSDESGISVSSADDANAATGRVRKLDVLPTGDLLDSGAILIKAYSVDAFTKERHEYEFYFDRVAITKWYHRFYSDDGRGGAIRSETRYSRPANTMSTSTENRRPISHL